ncbi:MAG: uracil-DNA glycosylase family protein [Candidatus Thermoplasmatota archaeon]
MSVLKAAERLRDALESTRLDVPFVYDPLQYAWGPHAAYVTQYGDISKAGRVLLIGMNPGPNGMGQTGVPFGDVEYVRDWMGITGAVTQPKHQHPKRPITGFATTRREPSGSRLYGWASARFGTAASFFDRFFVANYCPLLFFDDEGKNLTPPQLPVATRRAVDEACEAHLSDVVEAIEPSLVVGIGAYAEQKARHVMAERGHTMGVGGILHPSPASPLANKGWAQQAEKQLRALGVVL